MGKLILLLGVIVAAIIAESSSQVIIRPTYRPRRGGPVIIRPTYRPPFRKPISNIRLVREAGNEEPNWLFKGDDIPRAPASGDHPILPSVIDDIKLDPNRRYARSVDSPSAKRGGGTHSTLSSSRNTGATHPGYNRRNSRSVDSHSARRHGGSHSTSSGSRDTGHTYPGYNRRNARNIRIPTIYGPFRPKPTIPRPLNPFYPRPSLPTIRPFPIYARATRDLHIPGLKKPTHHDVIIPNWNPNARVNPWQRIGVKSRNTRSVEMMDDQLEHQDLFEDLEN